MTIHGSQQGCAELSDAGASSDGSVGRCTEPAEDLTMAPARLDNTHRDLRDDEFWRAIPAGVRQLL